MKMFQNLSDDDGPWTPPETPKVTAMELRTKATFTTECGEHNDFMRMALMLSESVMKHYEAEIMLMLREELER